MVALVSNVTLEPPHILTESLNADRAEEITDRAGVQVEVHDVEIRETSDVHDGVVAQHAVETFDDRRTGVDEITGRGVRDLDGDGVVRILNDQPEFIGSQGRDTGGDLIIAENRDVVTGVEDVVGQLVGTGGLPGEIAVVSAVDRSVVVISVISDDAVVHQGQTGTIQKALGDEVEIEPVIHSPADESVRTCGETG